MDQHAHQLYADKGGATPTVPSDRKTEELRPDASSGHRSAVIDVDLPDLMVDVDLDKELEEFLDRVIATGILIY